MRTPRRVAAIRAARIVTPDAVERQTGEELLQLTDGLGVERRLHALVVLAGLQVALRECLAKIGGRLLPVAVAGPIAQAGRGGVDTRSSCFGNAATS